MKKLATAFAAAAMVLVASNAQARGHHHHHHYRHHHHYLAQGSLGQSQNFQPWAWSEDHHTIHAFPGRISDPRPHAWCGWYMRHLLGVANRAFNLARNWAHWGHAGPPGVGAVVVWPHHVGKIVGRSGGEWVIQSGNDGHAVRTRPRSVRGAIAFRWG